MRTDDKPTWRRVLDRASSKQLGVVLLVVTAVYLAVATFIEEWSLDKTRLLPNTGGAYSHWLLWVLVAASCASLMLASCLRVPLRWSHLGAWCSHAGLIVLAAGSAWYALAHVSGNCVIDRTADGWGSARQFHQISGLMAVHVGQGEYPAASQTALPVPAGRTVTDMDVPIDCGLEGVSIRALRCIPLARVRVLWHNDSPNPVPAVMLTVRAGQSAGRYVLCDQYADTRTAALLIQFVPAPAPEGDRPASGPYSGTHDPRLMTVYYAGQGQPILDIPQSDGKRRRETLSVGQPVAIPTGEGHPIAIQLDRTLTHARRELTADVVGLDDRVAPGEAIPVLKVRIESGDWRLDQTVPFSTYELPGSAQRVQLPGGRSTTVGFSRFRRPLPVPVRIVEARYETHPASSMPKDYICRLEIGTGRAARTETLSLNCPVMVGRYQFMQGTWGDDPGNTSRIVFAVGDCLGLPVIWVGCVMICVGIGYAFYVKPLILRPRARR